MLLNWSEELLRGHSGTQQKVNIGMIKNQLEKDQMTLKAFVDSFTENDA